MHKRTFHPSDSRLAGFNGRGITSLTPLNETLYDRAETGPMYAITVDGYEAVLHAFAEEISPRVPIETADDDMYTSEPTVIRIYHEDCGDELPWHVDGERVERNGTEIKYIKYTEHVERFVSLEAVLNAVPKFIEDTRADGVTWDGIDELHEGM